MKKKQQQQECAKEHYYYYNSQPPPPMLRLVWMLPVVVIVSFVSCYYTVEGFVVVRQQQRSCPRRVVVDDSTTKKKLVLLQGSNDDKDDKTKKKGGGYKFGDLFLNRMGRKLTGNEEYEFGDITKAVGKSLTGKEEYEFGDISRHLDQLAKDKVKEYTKKDTYQVGDLTKEILKRASSGEYTLSDMFLLLRILASFGVTVFTPVASILPAKMLLDLFNYSIGVDVAGKLTGLLAESLDKRFKEALTGNENYQLGDVTKQKVMQFIGKDTKDDENGEKSEYQFGDFSRAVQKRIQQQQEKGPSISNNNDNNSVIIDVDVVEDLEKFDKQWVEQNPALPPSNK